MLQHSRNVAAPQARLVGLIVIVAMLLGACAPASQPAAPSGGQPSAPQAKPTEAPAAKAPAQTKPADAKPADAGAKPAAGAAKPQTVAELAQYRGADRKQILEEKSKQEDGRLVIYSSGQIMRPLLDVFQQRYPHIKAETIVVDSAVASRRMVEEYRAGRYDFDALELSIGGLLIPAEEGILQSYYSPELMHYPDDVKNAQGFWTIIRSSFVGLGYNTNKVTDAEAPKSFKDIADPKWRGRMGLSNSSSTGGNWIGTMLETQDEAFVRSLKNQNMKVIEGSGRVVADLIIAGEVDLSPTIFNSHVFASREKGAPITWVPMEHNFATEVTFAMASRSQRPASSLLLGDFLLSKEGQEMYKALGYTSAHNEAQAGQPAFGKSYFTQLPDYEEKFDKWARLFQETFITR
jgi:iron(III) transport system substrate-binding protein